MGGLHIIMERFRLLLLFLVVCGSFSSIATSNFNFGSIYIPSWLKNQKYLEDDQNDVKEFRNIRDVSQQVEDNIDVENDVDDIFEQIKRDVVKPHKRSKTRNFKRFYNVEMLRKFLFDIQKSQLFGRFK